MGVFEDLATLGGTALGYTYGGPLGGAAGGMAGGYIGGKVSDWFGGGNEFDDKRRAYRNASRSYDQLGRRSWDLHQEGLNRSLASYGKAQAIFDQQNGGGNFPQGGAARAPGGGPPISPATMSRLQASIARARGGRG